MRIFIPSVSWRQQTQLSHKLKPSKSPRAFQNILIRCLV